MEPHSRPWFVFKSVVRGFDSPSDPRALDDAVNEKSHLLSTPARIASQAPQRTLSGLPPALWPCSQCSGQWLPARLGQGAARHAHFEIDICSTAKSVLSEAS
jgi:hypothetical protein